MSTLLSAHAVGFDNAFGTLFHNISFSLKTGDRIGLLGANGCGKSTLLKILNRELDASHGSLSQASHCQVARIEQQLPSPLLQVSLLDAVVAQLPPAQRQSEGWRAEALLASQGFSPLQQTQTTATLSGGQHMRLLLARALIMQPDLLLLDEPSNHLDLPTLLWLERFLQQWDGSFVLVSHDSTLLDRVTQSSWFLRDQTLQCFALPCSAAREAQAQQDEADARRCQAEQKEIDRLAKSAQRLAIWGRTYDNEGLSRKAQQMAKRVDWLKEVQTSVTRGSPWRLQLHGTALDADRVLALPEMTVRPSAAGEVLFSLPELQVKSGDRIALVGHNGCGKSTLLRHLWQRYQQQPEAWFHPRVQSGYYDQSLKQLADEDTLIAALARFAAFNHQQAKKALIAAGFPFQRHQQSLASLSGGERSRLLFVGLSLSRYSLLLLDEPTNHLDMAGKEELALALNHFAGAVILVTHDRALMAQSCNRFWLIEQQQLTEWPSMAAVADRMTAAQPLPSPPAVPVAATPTVTGDEDVLLATLLDLQQKLADDLQRKPKHQKPTLQAEWQQQITRLSAELGLL